MEGVTLLREARAAGLRVEADGERLLVRGPRRAEELARHLLERKAAVLAALRREAEDDHRDHLQPEGDHLRPRGPDLRPPGPLPAPSRPHTEDPRPPPSPGAATWPDPLPPIACPRCGRRRFLVRPEEEPVCVACALVGERGHCPAVSAEEQAP